MHKIWLICKREYLTRVMKKSFLLMTLLSPLLIIVFYGFIFYFSFKKDLAEEPDEKPVQKKERKPRAKKIKTAEKVQLEEFKPIEDEEELVSKDVADKEDMREAMEVGEVVVPAALLQVTQADFEPKEPESLN